MRRVNIRMKALLICLAFMYSSLAYSVGWQWIHGKNESGVELFLFPFWESKSELSSPELYQTDPETGWTTLIPEAQNMHELVSLDRDTKFTPQVEECFFEYSHDGKSGKFYCKNIYNSLLSGVSYKITQNSNLNDCTYYAKFVCIKGCEKKGLPQLLIQDHWECHEQ